MSAVKHFLSLYISNLYSSVKVHIFLFISDCKTGHHNPLSTSPYLHRCTVPFRTINNIVSGLFRFIVPSPGEFRLRRSPLYFMKPSYWSQRKKRYVEVSSVYEAEVNGTTAAGQEESTEAVSPEFRGKEAIR